MAKSRAATDTELNLFNLEVEREIARSKGEKERIKLTQQLKEQVRIAQSSYPFVRILMLLLLAVDVAVAVDVDVVCCVASCACNDVMVALRLVISAGVADAGVDVMGRSFSCFSSDCFSVRNCSMVSLIF